LAVFGRRRYQGKPHLVLILPDRSRSLIPTEWTELDSFTPGSLTLPKQNAHLGFVKDLLHTRAVVDALLHRRATSINNGEKSVPEENNHLATHSELSRHPHPGNPGLGNDGKRAKDGGDRSSGSTDCPLAQSSGRAGSGPSKCQLGSRAGYSERLGSVARIHAEIDVVLYRHANEAGDGVCVAFCRASVPELVFTSGSSSFGGCSLADLPPACGTGLVCSGDCARPGSKCQH